MRVAQPVEWRSPKPQDDGSTPSPYTNRRGQPGVLCGQMRFTVNRTVGHNGAPWNPLPASSRTGGSAGSRGSWHPPCHGHTKRSMVAYRQAMCLSPPVSAEDAQRECGHANRCPSQGDLWRVRRVVQWAARRSLEPYVAGSNPAPPANHPRVWTHPCELSVVEGSRDWSRRPLIRGWFSGRCFAHTKLTRIGRASADGLIAVRQGCSSMAEPLADAGSSPAAPRLDGPWCRPRPQPGTGWNGRRHAIFGNTIRRW